MLKWAPVDMSITVTSDSAISAARRIWGSKISRVMVKNESVDAFVSDIYVGTMLFWEE